MKHLTAVMALAMGLLTIQTTTGAPSAPLAEAAGHASRLVRIVPYEIDYAISLLRANERSGMLMASGRLTSRLDGSPCYGWSSTSGMKVRFVFRREATRETESRVASWESDDGNRFYSRIERYLNGLPVETVRVRVERDKPGRPFRLEMTEPDRRSATLPSATLFPTAALKRLLAAARAGKRQLSLLLYEGDEEAAPQHVVALIGKRHAPLMPASDTGEKAAPSPGGQGDLRELRRLAYWPVSLAYYGAIRRKDGTKATDREKEAASSGLPEYEVHFRLYENGVTGEALLIYPDYVLQATPTRLKLLAVEACE